jgi:hypothetical protein
MPAKVFFCALTLLLLPSLTGLAQEQKNDQPKLSSSTKMKITDQLKDSSHQSVFAFDQTGDETSTIPLNTMKTSHTRSLKDYVVAIQKDAGKEGPDGTAPAAYARPITACKDPQALDPPPPCVICKDGTILCSKATFGMRVTMDEDKLPKTQPQE